MVKVEFENDFLENLKNKRFFIIFLVIFVVLVFVHLSGDGVEVVEGCEIMYGPSECREGEIVTGFYNPNPRDVDSVTVYVPTQRGENVYDVESKLPSNETRVLRTGECDGQEKKGMEVEWCCGDSCFTRPMDDPSHQIMVD